MDPEKSAAAYALLRRSAVVEHTQQHTSACLWQKATRFTLMRNNGGWEGEAAGTVEFNVDSFVKGECSHQRLLPVVSWPSGSPYSGQPITLICPWNCRLTGSFEKRGGWIVIEPWFRTDHERGFRSRGLTPDHR
jgi:hypothetical protein